MGAVIEIHIKLSSAILRLNPKGTPPSCVFTFNFPLMLSHLYEGVVELTFVITSSILIVLKSLTVSSFLTLQDTTIKEKKKINALFQ